MLFGTVLGVLWRVIFEIRHLTVAHLGSTPVLMTADYLIGGRFALSACVAQIPNSIQATLIFFFLFFILRVILRKQWLAAAAFS